jgi:hypothetical protein
MASKAVRSLQSPLALHLIYLFHIKAASSALGGLVNGAATASAPQNFTNTVTLPPINVDKKVNLFNNSISCGDAKLALSLDANAQINALATVTVDASGTLVPPVVDSFSLVGKMNGTISGDITLGGDLTVRFVYLLFVLLTRSFRPGLPRQWKNSHLPSRNTRL